MCSVDFRPILSIYMYTSMYALYSFCVGLVLFYLNEPTFVLYGYFYKLLITVFVFYIWKKTFMIFWIYWRWKLPSLFRLFIHSFFLYILFSHFFYKKHNKLMVTKSMLYLDDEELNTFQNSVPNNIFIYDCNSKSTFIQTLTI